MFEIPVNKELTANCLIETFAKLEELILAAVVKYGLIRVTAVPDEWYLMIWFVFGPQ